MAAPGEALPDSSIWYRQQVVEQPSTYVPCLAIECSTNLLESGESEETKVLTEDHDTKKAVECERKKETEVLRWMTEHIKLSLLDTRNRSITRSSAELVYQIE